MTWKVDVRLPGKRNSNSHGARPVHLIITMIKWIQTSRLSIKNSLSGRRVFSGDAIGTSLGGVSREQQMLKGHLPRVIYHQVY